MAGKVSIRVLRSDAHGHPQEVALGQKVAVVARWVGNEWEPVYALRGRAVEALPSCFRLNGSALRELDKLR